MTEFTPGVSAAGGLLIGAAAALLLLGMGRVAGISGIPGSVVSRSAGPLGWRVAFLVGLPIGAALVARGGGTAPASIDISAGPLALVMAGLLVGFGTQLGSGCTSGHGVCGIARGSRRSITGTLVFMAAGFATVYVVRHLVGGGV
jgi:uncharacterized membrane protein YedE/YeeE